MFGLSLSFLIGYVVARWFGDAIKNVVKAVYDEVESVIEEWV